MQTHSSFVAMLCIDWIDTHARDSSSRDKFVLLYTMLPFANFGLAQLEDMGVVIDLGFKHEQN